MLVSDQELLQTVFHIYMEISQMQDLHKCNKEGHQSNYFSPNVASAVLPISVEITACPLFSETSVARGDFSSRYQG